MGKKKVTYEGYFVKNGRAGFHGFLVSSKGNPQYGMYERIVQQVANPKDRSGFVANKIFEMSEVDQQWRDITKSVESGLEIRQRWLNHQGAWTLEEVEAAMQTELDSEGDPEVGKASSRKESSKKPVREVVKAKGKKGKATMTKGEAFNCATCSKPAGDHTNQEPVGCDLCLEWSA